jgi:hypothetical protein
VVPVLDERPRRLGWGGIKWAAAAVGVDPETVSRGVKEIAAGESALRWTKTNKSTQKLADELPRHSNTYPTGLKITDWQMRQLLHQHIT